MPCVLEEAQLGGIERVLQELVAALALPFQLDGDSVQVSASVGVALYPGDADDMPALLRHADQAMYAAKSAGRNGYSYFTPALQQAAELRRNTVREIRQALAQEQFELHYQPIISLEDGGIGRAEALLRWRHPLRGLLGPADFIAFAQANGLMIDIGDWVFRQAVLQARQWQADYGVPLQISINKSAVEFRCDAALYQGWGEHLARAGVAPGAIVIELTEGVLLDEGHQVSERLQQFRSMGLTFSLDDFGSGHASLSCLQKHAIAFLKIDPALVRALGQGDAELAMCEAIIGLAQRLGVKVVAEGVETATQRELLRAAGCDYAQGYVFSGALPAGQFGAMLAAQADQRR